MCKLSQIAIIVSMFLFSQAHPGKTNINKSRKPRVSFNENNRTILEESYKTSRYLNLALKKALSELTGRPENDIITWYQNRRAKEKRIHGAISKSKITNINPPDSYEKINTYSIYSEIEKHRNIEEITAIDIDFFSKAFKIPPLTLTIILKDTWKLINKMKT